MTVLQKNKKYKPLKMNKWALVFGICSPKPRLLNPNVDRLLSWKYEKFNIQFNSTIAINPLKPLASFFQSEGNRFTTFGGLDNLIFLVIA